MSKKKKKNTKRTKTVEAINDIFDIEPITHNEEILQESQSESLGDVAKIGDKKKSIAILGGILTVFALIGFVFTINFGYQSIKNFSTGASSKKDFLKVIYPVVMIDATEFNDISELSSDQIISSSIWSILMSTKELEKYNATMDVINVPVADVEEYAKKIFGENIPKLAHTNVGAGELSFYYVVSTNSYNVPANPMVFSYVPDIKSVNINDDIYTLEVDYLTENPQWRELDKGFEDQVVKTVEFKLHKIDDNYIIESLKVLNVNQMN